MCILHPYGGKRAMTMDEALAALPEKWREYQQSEEYKKKMEKAQEIAAINEGQTE
jgi:hypothetical protein